jgi:hypothetical protein
MSSTDISNDVSNDKQKDDIDRKIEEKIDNNSKLIKKPELIRRNAIANLELTDSYKEFIKYYNNTQK